MNRKTIVITIQGMSCLHCVNHVEKALEGVNGVESVSVELSAGIAVIIASDEV